MGRDETSIMDRVLADIDSLATHKSSSAANLAAQVPIATQ